MLTAIMSGPLMALAPPLKLLLPLLLLVSELPLEVRAVGLRASAPPASLQDGAAVDLSAAQIEDDEEDDSDIFDEAAPQEGGEKQQFLKWLADGQARTDEPPASADGYAAEAPDSPTASLMAQGYYRNGQPKKMPPAEEKSAKAMPADEVPAKTAPAADASAKKMPVEDAYAKKAPVEDTYAKKAPVEDAYAKKAPVEAEPAAKTVEAPAKAAPAKDSGYAKKEVYEPVEKAPLKKAAPVESEPPQLKKADAPMKLEAPVKLEPLKVAPPDLKSVKVTPPDLKSVKVAPPDLGGLQDSLNNLTGAGGAAPAAAPAALVPEGVCHPPCLEGRGICNDGVCFCRSPYRGIRCQTESDIALLRFNYGIVAVIVVLSAVIGFAASIATFRFVKGAQASQTQPREADEYRIHKETWRKTNVGKK